MLLLYATNDAAAQAAKLLHQELPGSVFRLQNPKYWAGEVPSYELDPAGKNRKAFERVFILDGSPQQEEIISTLGEAGVPVEVIGEPGEPLEETEPKPEPAHLLPDLSEIEDLGELKRIARAEGVSFGHRIGVKTLKKRIEAHRG